jgi:ribosomal protein S18 acetylase RimI-like enzyme
MAAVERVALLHVMETRLTMRRATEADASVLAALHIQAWQWAYRGQLPDTFLDELASTRQWREAWRREMFARPPGDERTWVAEIGGRVVGFADTRPSRDADVEPATAELATLYLDPQVVGTGVGRALLRKAMADLHQRGYRVAVLWVLETNVRARRFYEIAGWRSDGTIKSEQRSGVELREMRYRVDLTGA